MSDNDKSRRDFVKKTAYIAPAVLSFQAFSSLAKAGSAYDPNGNGPDVELKVERKAAKEQAKCERKETRINETRMKRGKDPIDLDC